MPNLFALIGESWDFCRRQQAIGNVSFWYLFLPALATVLLTDYEIRNEEVLQDQPELLILIAISYIALALLITWGSVCVMTIGKRLLQAKSGRTRSSFKAVRVQAGPFFIPYVLTSILRTVFTLLWTLLLIVPGIIYIVRTAFYGVIVVCEDTSYRAALARSKEVTKGKFWPVLGTLVGLSFLTVIPAQILSALFTGMATDAPFGITLAAGVASAIVTSLALVLYLLSLIQAYGSFRPASVVSN